MPASKVADARLNVFEYPALQPKLPIEERLRAQGLPEAEVARRKKISDSARGRVPWNKGKKHSAGGSCAPVTCVQQSKHMAWLQTR